MRTIDLPKGTIIYENREYHCKVIGFDEDGRMMYENSDGRYTTTVVSYNNNKTEDWDVMWSFEIPKSTNFQTLYDRLKD